MSPLPVCQRYPSQLALRSFCPFFRPSGHTWRGGVWRGGVWWRMERWRLERWRVMAFGESALVRQCRQAIGDTPVHSESPRRVPRTQKCAHPFVRIQRCDRVPVSGVEYITAVSHASASATESALTAPAFPAQPPFLPCLFPRKVTYDTSSDSDCDL